MKSQKSILVVDDDSAMGEVILDILSTEYEEVIFCNSPMKAKALVASKNFSLIISDVQMSELQGPEFIKLVRSLGKIEPFVFLTGSATKEVLFSALRLGAADVIEKPFNNEDLIKTVQRVLELEKRKLKLYETIFSKKEDIVSLTEQKRMIGLLQAVGEKK